jgi:hypothetical protein
VVTAPDVSPVETDAETERAEEICFPVRGRTAGVNVWIPGDSKDAAVVVTRRLVEALDLVPERTRLGLGITTQAPAGQKISLTDGPRSFYFRVPPGAKLESAKRDMAESIAEALLAASLESAAVKAELHHLRVVPFRS